MKTLAVTMLAWLCLAACQRNATAQAESTAVADEAHSQAAATTAFDADSAYSYVARQVEFGPRVPGSEAHMRCGDWLASELKRHGAEVVEQRVTLRAFDGTELPARNIMGRINADAPERILLLAHWDCRPWADNDPDPARHSTPVDGANDGASGVGVILEIARQLKQSGSKLGVDFLFTDAEDYGTENDELSWAMGTRYFVENPPVQGYRPAKALLLDMVGGEGSIFAREYFSQQQAPALMNELWAAAAATGAGDLFVNSPGGGITDDHLELLKAGIPAIDIIGFSPQGGFHPTWHTSQDNMNHISRQTLGAVGSTVLFWLSQQ